MFPGEQYPRLTGVGAVFAGNRQSKGLYEAGRDVADTKKSIGNDH